jgi:hypothetical protein
MYGFDFEMASPEKRTVEIVDAFTRYLESKNMSLIEHFTRDEIEIALLQLIKDGESPYYVAMQIRREELKKIDDIKREKWAIWKYRLTIFIVGLILGFIFILLKLIYFS